MPTPQRIQRKRTKGWRMPEGVIYVGRPGPHGNPYREGDDCPECEGSGFAMVGWDADAYENIEAACELCAESGELKGEAVLKAFEKWLLTSTTPEGKYARIVLPRLRGKDLACWCPLSSPCHADVLLRLANP